MKGIQEEKQLDSGQLPVENTTGFRIETLMSQSVIKKQSPDTIIRLKSQVYKESDSPKTIFFPGIEGICDAFENLASLLNANVFSFQYALEYPAKTIQNMTEILLPVWQIYVMMYYTGWTTSAGLGYNSFVSEYTEIKFDVVSKHWSWRRSKNIFVYTNFLYTR